MRIPLLDRLLGKDGITGAASAIRPMINRDFSPPAGDPSARPA